jgi:hypothetical protein
MSDKALLAIAKGGNIEAAEILMKRWAVKGKDASAAIAKWRGHSYLSVTAARAIAEGL